MNTVRRTTNLNLVELMNEELSQAARDTYKRRDEVQAHIEDLRSRLHKLYGALETGHLSVADLAPRIKELRRHIEELEARHSSFDSTNEASLRLTREEVCHRFVIFNRSFSVDHLWKENAFSGPSSAVL